MNQTMTEVGEHGRARARRLEPSGLRVLIVDDDAALLSAYARMVGLRHRAVTAHGGVAAIRVLAEGAGSVDAIVCDMAMPEVDGLALYRYVAALAPGLERRMVFVSGAFPPAAREFLAAAGNPTLDKPFRIDELDAAIARVISG